MENGHCVLCEVVGQGSRDFVCENCGGHDKNVLYCAGCGSRYDATPEIMEIIRRFTSTEVPERKGVSIRISNCFECGTVNGETTVETYVLRTSPLH